MRLNPKKDEEARRVRYKGFYPIRPQEKRGNLVSYSDRLQERIMAIQLAELEERGTEKKRNDNEHERTP